GGGWGGGRRGGPGLGGWARGRSGGTSARGPGGGGEWSGPGETRIQVPRLPNTPPRSLRGAAAHGPLRPVQRCVGGAPRSVADAPGQHLLRHAVRAAAGDPPRRPTRAGAPLVHRAAADSAPAQYGVRRVLRPGEEGDGEGEGGLSAVQAAQPVQPGRIRRR